MTRRLARWGETRTSRARLTASLRNKILDVRGLDSSIILMLRVGILMSIGNFMEILSQRILAGIILVGRLGAAHLVRRAQAIQSAGQWAAELRGQAKAAKARTSVVVTICIIIIISSSSSSSTTLLIKSLIFIFQLI